MKSIHEIIASSPRIIRDMAINIYGYKLANDRFNPRFWKYYDSLLANLELKREEIDLLYFSNLKNSLIYAKKSKYYSKLFEKTGFFPEEIDKPDDIKLLPLLDKETIIENFNDIYIDNAQIKSVKHYSSGTTGPKFGFYVTNELLKVQKAAFMYRHYSLLGIKPFDKRITIGGRLFTNKRPYWSFNKSENQLLLSAHHISSTSINDYIAKIIDFDPVFIQGHPSAILSIAEVIIEKGISIPNKIKAIFTTGETLYEIDRKRISMAFNTIVFQQYGSGESVISAIEKPNETGYFSDIEMGYIELNKLGNSENHEIIGTSFLNPAFPFVRYKLNDYAIPVHDSGNDSFPLAFESIIGRVDDYLISPEGKIILPVTIRMLLKPYFNSGESYQLIQLNKFNFKLNLKCKSKEILSSYKVLLRDDILGSKAKIEINFVDKIVSNGGKIRNVINQMKS